MSTITTTPLQLWALAQHADTDTAYTAIAELVGLPTPEQVPHPGAAAGWDFSDWIRWGDQFGLRAAGTTRHQRMVEHRVWMRWRFGFANRSGDHRSSLNAARDVRQTYTELMEFLRQAAVCLHEEGQQQQPARLAGWFTMQTTGEHAVAVAARIEAQASKPMALDTPMDAEINRLMKPLRKPGGSYRQVMIQAGLLESRADWVVLANRGRAPGAWGYGKEAQALLEGLRRLSGEAEPEVLDPEALSSHERVRQELDEPGAELVKAPEPAPVAPVVEEVAAAEPLPKLESQVAQALQLSLKDMQERVKKGHRGTQSILEAHRKLLASYRSRQTWLYKSLDGLNELAKKMHVEIQEMDNDPVFNDSVTSLSKLSTVATALAELAPIADRALQAADLRDQLEAANRARQAAEQRAKELEDQLTDPNSQAEQLIGSFKKILTALSVSDFLQIAKGVEFTKTELEQWIVKLQK